MKKSQNIKQVKIPFVAKFIRLGFKYGGAIFPNYFGKLAYRFFSQPRKRAKHKVIDEILTAAQVSDFQYDTLTLKTYRWGNPEHPLVVLIHGWESRGTALKGFVPPLLEQGFQVATFDAPAHGDSEGNAANMPIYAKAIGLFFDKIGIPHAAIAHSFGGNSLMFYLSHLNKNTAIEKVILVAAPSNIYRVLDDASNFMHLADAAKAKFFAIIEGYINMPLEQCHVANFCKDINIGQLMLVHDEMDKIVPFEDSVAYHNAVPNSILVNAKDLGHFKLMKKKEIKEKIVTFIVAKKYGIIG
jgi:predicted alpha/beta hydrolase family esterase